MIRNYLKIAFRNLVKRKGYSLLNIAGLAIGITCCLVIFQYVAYERSYDTFNTQAPNIVRLRLDSYQQGKLQWKSATSYPAIGPTMKKEFPEVEDYCRLIDAEVLLSNDEKNIYFNEKKGYYADPSSINMLGVQLLRGNTQTVLDAPDKLIISEATSKKYFGDADPIGKKLSVKGGQFPPRFEVTGVFKNFPQNSHLIIDYLASYKTLGKIQRLNGDSSNATETAWNWYDFYTYIKLKPGTDPKKFESKLTAFCDAHINIHSDSKANRNELHVLPLADVHLYSNYNQEAEVNGDGQTVSFLFLIGILIIFIAWINYINLATARSIERAREVGVRKVLGAYRSDLIRQFLTESLVLNIISLTIAIGAAVLLTPVFNQFLGRTGSTGFRLPVQYWTEFLLLFFLGSFLAGIYPAFVLSGYRAVTVLKGVFKNSTSGILLRKGLIVTQFITSVVLVAGTMIVYEQLNYMRSQKLGTNISQTLVVEGTSAMLDSVYRTSYPTFKQELLKEKNIKNVTASTSVMGNEIYWTNNLRRASSDSKGITLYHLGIDYDFVPSFEIQLKAGRNFSKDMSTDKKAVMLNEEAVRALGFESAAAAVGQKVVRGNRDTMALIGVLADYHHQGLQKKVDPMVFLLRPDSRNYYSVKMGPENIPQTVASVQATWKKFFPEDPFNYFFLDDSFNQQYKSDQQFGSIFSVFAMLAILIACFGLAGLSAYNILQRRKEIGIRKVMGASVQQLLILLSKDFLRLVLVSFFIAIPVTILLMNRWLEDFAYRIHISWLVFVIAGVVSVFVAAATISFQAIKAALSNPVKSLRTE